MKIVETNDTFKSTEIFPFLYLLQKCILNPTNIFQLSSPDIFSTQCRRSKKFQTWIDQIINLEISKGFTNKLQRIRKFEFVGKTQFICAYPLFYAPKVMHIKIDRFEIWNYCIYFIKYIYWCRIHLLILECLNYFKVSSVTRSIYKQGKLCN